MAVSKSYEAFLQEQLKFVPELTSKRMFGGIGFYSTGLIFGVADNDTLFFKVNDKNRPRYEAAGMPGWDPMGTGASMSYFQVPPTVLEDPQTLAEWATLSAEASKKKPRKK